MTLAFGWEWESAPDVRAPELAATWSRLRIDVVGVTATLVEERASAHGIRKSIDVPTYPLAEWIAFNWWAIWAPRARKSSAGFQLSGAGDGFPWPDLTLLSGAGAVSASLTRRDGDPDFVRFLSSVSAVLDPESTATEMGRFIDATVRRLEDKGVLGTPLQVEWDVIASTTEAERDFCLVAAALDLDPYDLDDLQTASILHLEGISNAEVAADLASAVGPDHLLAAQEWVETALQHLRNSSQPHFEVPVDPLPFGERIPPWKVGYERARALRSRFSVGAADRLDLDDLIQIRSLDRQPPTAISALVGARGTGTTVAMGSSSPTAQRFTAARALGRRTFDAREGEILLTATLRPYAEKVERAFAAEFLAPAAGVEALLGGDYSENALAEAASRLNVASKVVEHQLENQLVT